MTDNNRWGVIYSPRAGARQGHKRWDMVRSYMESKNIAFDYVQSEGFGSVERLAGMLCANGYRTIVVVGGDGTLNDAVNGIMHADKKADDLALGLIPNGIGNDFARFWGRGVEDFRKAVDDVESRRVRKIDVGFCDFKEEDKDVRRYFVNCVNIGLGARLVNTLDEMKRIVGPVKNPHIHLGLAQIFERTAFKMDIKADMHNISGDVMSVCIGNSLGYGQTPAAVPYNGMLDMSVVTRPRWWQYLEGFWLLGKGHFLNYKNVKPYRISHIRVIDAGGASISIDGKIIKNKDILPMNIGIEKECLNYIIPSF